MNGLSFSHSQNPSHNKIIIDRLLVFDLKGLIYFTCFVSTLGSSLLAAGLSAATTATAGVPAVSGATAAVTQWATRLVMKLKSAETKLE